MLACTRKLAVELKAPLIYISISLHIPLRPSTDSPNSERLSSEIEKVPRVLGIEAEIIVIRIDVRLGVVR